MNGVRALPALLLAAAVAGLQIHASADHWHFADDVTNLRWVLEHVDAPWRALTERHAVHDHVRPLTLLATWAGASLSGGAWWGPRAALVGLLLGGLAGAGLLARRLAEGPPEGAAPRALLLVLALPGFQDLPWWNAWLCSAGELCCGMWALWATDRALARGRVPLAGLGLLLAAGLFKEPGFLVAAPMLALAWRHRAPRAALATAAAAAAGVAFTWHPANLLRAAGAEGSSMLSRLDAHLDQLTWPGAGLPEGGAAALQALTAGLALDPGWPLRALVLWLPLVLLASPHLAPRLALGLALPIALGAGQVWAGGPSAGWAALLAVGLALARGGAAQVGLVLLAATFLPVLPYPGTNAVQQLPGAVGLALAIAVACPPRLHLPLCLAAALTGGIGALARPAPEQVEQVEQTRARRAAILGLAAAAQELGSPDVEGRADDPDAREALLLAPLWGSRGLERAPGAARASSGGLQVGATVLLADPSPLLAFDLLAGRELPLARARDDRPRPGRSARAQEPEPGLALELPAGRYLLGVDGRAGDLHAAVAAADACGHAWPVPAALPAVQAVAVAVELDRGCSPLRLHRTAPPGRGQGLPFLVALPEATLSLPAAPVRPAVVEVRPQLPHLPAQGGGGPRAPSP
ncbi:hypothetical protein L6R53_11185 [Myxococcota bacterium]|nr:hypothetical protein [Myxococcota bacterium]